VRSDSQTRLARPLGDDALILQTQIARSSGLRKDFAKAQDILRSIEKPVLAAGPEVRARYALELGRTYASATHPQESQTVESRRLARVLMKVRLKPPRAPVWTSFPLMRFTCWRLLTLSRIDDALDIQLRLERECEAANAPDPYVFEELETLYRARGDELRANHYADRKKSVSA